MNEPVPELLKRGVIHQAVQHLPVLDLTHSDHRRQLSPAQCRHYLVNPDHFPVIPLICPPLRTVWEEFSVVRQGILLGIEQVLHIVKHNTGLLGPAFCRYHQ